MSDAMQAFFIIKNLELHFDSSTSSYIKFPFIKKKRRKKLFKSKKI